MTLLDVLPWAIAMAAVAAALWFLGAYLRALYRVEEAREAERATAARLRTALAESQAMQLDAVPEMQLVKEIERRAFHMAVCVAWKQVPTGLPSNLTSNLTGDRQMVLAMLTQAHALVLGAPSPESPDQGDQS